MNNLRALAVRMAIIVVVAWAGSGCGDGDRTICGSDETPCDGLETDTSGLDAVAPDVAGDTTLPHDTVADDLVDANTFLTGTARIKGRAYFTNMDDNSGFVARLWLGYYDDDGNELPPVVQVVTGSDGKFEIDGIPAGYYGFDVSHGPLTKEGRYSPYLGVQEGETLVLEDYAFTAVGAVDITLTDLDSGDWGDRAILYTPQRTALASADLNGYFNLDGLLPGKYDVCAGAENMVGMCFNQVEVVGLETTSLGEFELETWNAARGPGVNVSGKVTLFDRTDHGGIKVIYDPGPAPVVAYTDNAGNYSFENVRPGKVEIRFDSPEASGFERHSASMTYMLFAGTSEILPDQVLIRGNAIWQSLATDFRPQNARFTPDSKSVILLTLGPIDYDLGEYSRSLYSINLASGDVTWLADSVDYTYMVTPDSSAVIYNYGPDVGMLFSVAVDGGRRLVLTTRFSGSVAVSPDSRFATYLATYDDGIGLFAADLATGLEHRLCDGPLHSFAGDSKNVFCWGEPDEPLDIVRLDDGTPLYSADVVHNFAASPDSRTAFVCKPDHTADFVDLETGTVTPLAGDIGDCEMIQFMPDSGTVVYGALDGELMAARVDGGEPIVLDQEVSQPLLPTPDSTRIIYVRATDQESLIDLYVTDISGLQEPIQLTAGMPGTFSTSHYTQGRELDAFRVDSDSQAMFATVPSANMSSIELRRLKLDGSQDISFTYLCNNNCGNSLTWYVDETRRVVYMLKPFAKVQSRNIDTGAVLYESDEGLGFGIVAPDLSGTIVESDDPEAMAWMSFPDLTHRLVRPFEIPAYGMEWPHGTFGASQNEADFSPDGKLLMFESDVGGGGFPIVGTTDHRIMIRSMADL